MKSIKPYLKYYYSGVFTMFVGWFYMLLSNLQEPQITYQILLKNDFIFWLLLALLFPIIVIYVIPEVIYFILAFSLKKLWEKKNDLLKILCPSEHEIKNYLLDIVKSDDDLKNDLREKLPGEITTAAFKSLAYIEDNQKKLITENPSKYVKSFIHLNTSYYAVTAFIIRQSGNGRTEELLFVKDTGSEITDGKRYKPLGRRLPKNEIPDKYISEMLWEVLGIKENIYKYFDFSDNKNNYPKYQDRAGILDNDTKLLKQPIAIQLESNPQRDGVPHHVDFIYLIQLNKGESGSPEKQINTNLYTEWKTITEVKKMMDGESFCYENTAKIAQLIIDKIQNGEGLHLQP